MKNKIQKPNVKKIVAGIIKTAKKQGETAEGRKAAAELAAQAEERLAELRAKKDKAGKVVGRILDLLEGSDAHEILGEVLNSIKCPELYLNWTTDRFWFLQVKERVVPHLDRIHDELVKQKATEANPLWFNDGDNQIWHMPTKTKGKFGGKKKVFCHETQNYNHIFMWEPDGTGGGNLHVRQYFDQFTNPTDKWEREQVELLLKAIADHGVLGLLREGRGYLQQYADDVPGQSYPQQLSLDHYKKNGFNVKYGDFRDAGYVMSWEHFPAMMWCERLEGSTYSYQHIRNVAGHDVAGIVSELFDESIDTDG